MATAEDQHLVVALEEEHPHMVALSTVPEVVPWVLLLEEEVD
jgi:hypothetical protein